MALTDQERKFIEDTGMFFENQRLPRVAGRIMSWLLICNPPYQSAQDIGKTLEMSKGSVSTMTRLLVQMGMIERVGHIGARRDFYHIHPQATEQMLLARQAEFAQLQNLARQGLKLMEEQNADERQRLLKVSNMCSLVLSEISQLVERVHTGEDTVDIKGIKDE